MIIYYKIVFVRAHRVHATRVHSIVFLLRAVPFMVEHVLNMDFIHLSKSKNTMIAHCDLFEKYEDVIFKKQQQLCSFSSIDSPEILAPSKFVIKSAFLP